MIEIQPSHQPSRQPANLPHRKRGGRQPAAPKQKTAPSFEFVASDPTGRAPADSRKFIRSHVMRGKNTAKRVTRIREAPTPSWINAESSDARPSGPLSPGALARVSATVSQVQIESANDARRRKFVFLSSTFLGPFRPPPDLSLYVFADEIDDLSRGLIRRFFGSIKEAMFPVEWCCKFDLDKMWWFRWLLSDATYLHSILFTMSAFQDIINSGDPLVLGGGDLSRYFSRRTQVHLRRTIELLQERIQDQDQQTADVTAAVVVTLAMMADAAGDSEACEAHVNGLKEMVRLRGGMKAFGHNRQLQIKLCRVDLGWSVKTNCQPAFYEGDVSWSRFFDKIILNQKPAIDPAAPAVAIDALVGDLDLKLKNIFDDMRDFSRMANVLITSKDKLRPELFQEIMISVQYRILLLEYSLETQYLEEAVRIGILAFQTSVFIQMPGLRLKFATLADKLRLAITMMDASTPALADLKLWLLIIGAISLFDFGELWVLGAITDLTGGSEWPEIRERMKSIMWIDVVHDTPGKQIFRSIHTARNLGNKQPW